MELKVRNSQPASSEVSGWLNRLAGPAVQACRFQKCPFHIELRPTRFQVSGFALRSEPNLVFLSSRAQFWSQAGVVSTILHEYSHLLVFEFEDSEKVDAAAHGPVFFLVLLTLFRRVESAGILVGQLVFGLTLYDFQDSNHACLSGDTEAYQKELVLRWAFAEYEHLARSDLSAEALAREAHKRWGQYLDLRARAEFEALQRNQKIQSLNNEVAALRAEILVFRPPPKSLTVQLANWAMGLFVLVLWVAVTQR